MATKKKNKALLDEVINRDKCVLVGTYDDKLNRETIIHYICGSNNCEEQTSKILRYLYDYGAFYKACTTRNTEIKKIATNMKNHGVEHPMQREDVKNNIKQNNLINHGVTHTLQRKDVKAKIIETCMKNHGVANPFLSDEVKKKIEKTNIERFGHKNPLQNEEVRKKGEATTLERHGVPYALQNPEIAERYMKSLFSKKEFTFPCGNTVSVQGYEPFALEILVDMGFTAQDIVVGIKNVPEIWYAKDDKSHRYYCDIYIPKENKIIEVKSDWTFQLENGNVDQKAQATINAGFSYEIWVFTKNADLKILKY